MQIRTTGRALEIAGLLAVLAALAAYLLTARSIIPYSDPASWFVFGRNFSEQFEEAAGGGSRSTRSDRVPKARRLPYTS